MSILVPGNMSHYTSPSVSDLELALLCFTQVIPIIDIPGFGDRAAEKVCTDLKIASQNDTKKLAEAKALVYLKGFTDGVMVIGPYSGQKVRDTLTCRTPDLGDTG